MPRTVYWVVAGIAVGAAAGYALAVRSEHATTSKSGLNATLFAAPASSDRRRGKAFRESLYTKAALADAATLRKLVHEAAAAAPSTERSFTLSTLLARLAELDPAAAVALAENLALNGELVASLYAQWAQTDPAAALQAWHARADAHDSQVIGVALLPALGGDAQALDALLAALAPALDPARFRVEAIAALAQRQPARAFDLALATANHATQSRALAAVAKAWAATDTDSALARLDVFANAQDRDAFHETVLQGWAARDPQGVLQYLADREATGERTLRYASAALSEVALTQPLAAIAFADGLSGQFQFFARRVVLNVWARQDPRSALAYVEKRPASEYRDRLYDTAVRAFAAVDADGALAWASALKQPTGELWYALMSALPYSEQALQMALALRVEHERESALRALVEHAAYQGDLRTMADRVLALEGGEDQRQSLQIVAGAWANYDVAGAMSWLLQHAEQLPPQVFDYAAYAMARRDPAAAARYVGRVPPAARDGWILAVAQMQAEDDPDAAMSWLQAFDGEEVHSRAAATVVERWARTDPGLAARALAKVGDTIYAGQAAHVVAEQLTKAEPASAARWAEGLQHEPVRLEAIRGVVTLWARNDAPAARQWVLGLTDDSSRDSGLSELLLAASNSHAPVVPDAALLDAFSSADTRQQVVARIVGQVATVDPEAAQRLIEQYVSDPMLRLQAQQQIVDWTH